LEDMHKNDFVFSFPVILIFRPQICSPSCSCPALCFHFSTAFLLRKNRRHWTDGQIHRRTDWRTATPNATRPWVGCIRRNNGFDQY